MGHHLFASFQTIQLCEPLSMQRRITGVNLEWSIDAQRVAEEILSSEDPKA